MPLSPEQQKHVSRHLNTRSTAPTCPVCGASNLRVAPDIAHVPRADGDTRPLVAVECQYCGHVLHFAPEVMDLDLEGES